MNAPSVPVPPVVLRHGDHAFAVQIERAGRLELVVPRAPEPGGPEAILRAALDHPTGLPPLRELAAGRRSAAILVPGKDRIAGADRYLPLLLAELAAGGIPEDRIEVVLATGTHARHSEEEIRRILGVEAAPAVRFRQHDPRPGPHLQELGTTSFGTRVELDRAVLEADLKVLTGQVLPHYFAGFGGGRKALLPGVASQRTILQNHARVLGPGSGIHPAVATCRLAGNPVHLDMLEAARMVESCFVFNTLVDGARRIVAAVAGELEAAHLEGCALARDWFRIPVTAPVDLALASAGGWPFDCDFVQSLKALFGVREVVKPGGTILWVAECRQGMKEGFRRWAACPTLEAMEQAVRADYDLAGHNSILLRSLTARLRVGLVSGLPAESVRALGIEPFAHLDDGLAWAADPLPDGYAVAIAPFGNLTHAAIEEAP